jgi:hypothetical protein
MFKGFFNYLKNLKPKICARNKVVPVLLNSPVTSTSPLYNQINTQINNLTTAQIPNISENVTHTIVEMFNKPANANANANAEAKLEAELKAQNKNNPFLNLPDLAIMKILNTLDNNIVPADKDFNSIKNSCIALREHALNFDKIKLNPSQNLGKTQNVLTLETIKESLTQYFNETISLWASLFKTRAWICLEFIPIIKFSYGTNTYHLIFPFGIEFNSKNAIKDTPKTIRFVDTNSNPICNEFKFAILKNTNGKITIITNDKITNNISFNDEFRQIPIEDIKNNIQPYFIQTVNCLANHIYTNLNIDNNSIKIQLKPNTPTEEDTIKYDKVEIAYIVDIAVYEGLDASVNIAKTSQNSISKTTIDIKALIDSLEKIQNFNPEFDENSRNTIWSKFMVFPMIANHLGKTNTKIVLMQSCAEPTKSPSGAIGGAFKQYKLLEKRKINGRLRNVYKKNNKLFVKSKNNFIGLKEYKKLT